MNYDLVCVHPFGDYTKGQRVSNRDEVAKLLAEREENFVRVAVPKEEQLKLDFTSKVESKNPKKG